VSRGDTDKRTRSYYETNSSFNYRGTCGVDRVLTGCEIPVTQIPDKKLKPPAVAAPSNVKAFAYEGLNIVTWAPVPNVVGYRVYRRDLSASQKSLGVEPTELTAGTPDYITDLYYADPVKSNNQLVDGHEYVYYVESISGGPTAPGRRVSG
jgi:hypothetical protein